MWINGRFLPLYSPADEGAGGGADDAGAQVDQGVGGGADTGGAADGGKPNLRQQLEKGFEDGRKADVAAAKRDAKSGQYQSSARREGITGGAEEKPGEAAGGAAAGAAAAVAGAATVEPPKALTEEAKAAWAQTPPAIQAAFLKREQDMQRGVEELKGRYAEIDRALEPHMGEIRKNGKTPAQAVQQLFAWFQAFAANPDVAFPALAKSFNYDLARLGVKADAAGGAAAAAGGTPAAGQPAGDVPPAVQQYITKMEARLNELEQKSTQQYDTLASSFQRETQAKTEEVLSHWAKDKPHFEAVRGYMAQLIQSGTIPLKDGKVDLDGAYDAAIYAMPEVRAKVLAEAESARQKAIKDKTEAERKAQQDQADRARKAGVSLTGGAPGAPGVTQPGRKGKGKSVRESIEEAREQLRS